jgi:hypothetical protein
MTAEIDTCGGYPARQCPCALDKANGRTAEKLSHSLVAVKGKTHNILAVTRVERPQVMAGGVQARR